MTESGTQASQAIARLERIGRQICEITISWSPAALGAQRLPGNTAPRPPQPSIGYLRPEQGFRSLDLSGKTRLQRASSIRFCLVDTAPSTTALFASFLSTSSEEDHFVVRSIQAPARNGTNSPAIAWTPTGTSTNSRGNVWLRSRLPLILCACDILSVAAFDRNRVRIDAATSLDTDREILSSIATSANAPIASVCKRTVAAQASSRDTPRLGRKWRRSWTCSCTRPRRSSTL